MTFQICGFDLVDNGGGALFVVACEVNFGGIVLGEGQDGFGAYSRDTLSAVRSFEPIDMSGNTDLQ